MHVHVVLKFFSVQYNTTVNHQNEAHRPHYRNLSEVTATIHVPLIWPESCVCNWKILGHVWI